MRKKLPPVVLLAAVAVAVVLVVADKGWRHGRDDPRLSAGATERALQARLNTAYEFRCSRRENDISIELDDVDYECEPDRASEDGYWVGTNGHEITGIQSMG